MSRVVLNVTEPADLVFAVSVAGQYEPNHERFTPTLDGVEVEHHELFDAHGTRLRRLTSGVGQLEVSYSATILGRGATADADETDLLVYTRPSRYAESDSLSPIAHAEFAGIDDPVEILASVSSWVGTQLAYMSGTSLPTDGAVRTLLARQGVCRDFSHLCVALLRALGIPARVVAVYAPGLNPMDFHAVAEAWVNGGWQAIDATTLAPRSALVRIATGRDAADTAFLNVMSGRADLVSTEIGAVVDDLPGDDITQLVQIS